MFYNLIVSEKNLHTKNQTNKKMTKSHLNEGCLTLQRNKHRKPAII